MTASGQLSVFYLDTDDTDDVEDRRKLRQIDMVHPVCLIDRLRLTRFGAEDLAQIRRGARCCALDPRDEAGRTLLWSRSSRRLAHRLADANTLASR